MKTFFNYSYDISRHHHERWDGRGYPDGLKGDEITIWSQVVAVADVYDALTSPRVYKAAFDHQTAMKMITEANAVFSIPRCWRLSENAFKKSKRRMLSSFLRKRNSRNRDAGRKGKKAYELFYASFLGCKIPLGGI